MIMPEKYVIFLRKRLIGVLQTFAQGFLRAGFGGTRKKWYIQKCSGTIK
jgi:hypothetical protein